MTNEPLFTTRRDFLTGSMALLSACATLPVFLGRTAHALAGPSPQSKKRKDDASRILVVCQLAGGNDGLNTVIPWGMDPYYKYRRQLAIPKKDALKLVDGIGLHPSAVGLKDLFDEGKLAIVQGVGYPNPNRSHFTSMDIWQTADPSLRKHDGWIGRYFDNCCKGDDPGPQPINGVALMQESPLAMQGEDFIPLSFNDAAQLAWRGAPGDDAAASVLRKLNNEGAAAAPAGENEVAQWLQRAALEAQVGADTIRRAAGESAGGGRRRGGGRAGQFGQQLQMVARMIRAGLPTRIYYVSMGGFDTHSGQIGRHQQLLAQFGDAMVEFLDRLEDDGLLDRVLVLTFSEFGRRVQENASGGTDHGEAAPLFLLGSKVKAGVHEKHPDLENLHRGDLTFGCDFRRVYSTILQSWLGAKPDQVLGKGFAPLPVIRG